MVTERKQRQCDVAHAYWGFVVFNEVAETNKALASDGIELLEPVRVGDLNRRSGRGKINDEREGSRLGCGAR